MKKVILTTLAMVGLAFVGYSQGVITVDTTEGSSVISILGVPDTTQDINMELMYLNGATYAPVVTFLLSDASGDSSATVPWGAIEPAASDISFFNALYDGNGNVYQSPTIASPTVVTFKVAAWTGNDSTYAQALTDLTGQVGISGAFGVALTSASAPLLANISTMPSFDLETPTPEPATFAMMGLGGLSLLLFRRRK